MIDEVYGLKSAPKDDLNFFATISKKTTRYLLDYGAHIEVQDYMQSFRFKIGAI